MHITKSFIHNIAYTLHVIVLLFVLNLICKRTDATYKDAEDKSLNDIPYVSTYKSISKEEMDYYTEDEKPIIDVSKITRPPVWEAKGDNNSKNTGDIQANNVNMGESKVNVYNYGFDIREVFQNIDDLTRRIEVYESTQSVGHKKMLSLPDTVTDLDDIANPKPITIHAIIKKI